jgi:aspartokinase
MMNISYCPGVSLVTLSSLPCDSRMVAQVLTQLSEAGINVDMISQTAPQGGAIRLSFSIADGELGNALTRLGGIMSHHPDFSSEILPGNCKLAFYDPMMTSTPGVAAEVFRLLASAGIQVMLVTTSDVDISLLISSHDVTDALQLVQEHYQVTPEEVML